MSRVVPAGLVALAVLLAAVTSEAQWSAGGGQLQLSNLLEYQAGRNPATEAEDRTRLVNQFILDYTQDEVSVGLRYENFQVSGDDLFTPLSYGLVTQKYAQWSRSDLTVRVGNGYAMLGRGLLFRAFELPGVVRDAVWPASRYFESRDLDGVTISARRGPFDLDLVSGRPVSVPDTPYNDSEFLQRRTGTLSGGHFGVNAADGVRVGASYVRSDVFDFEEQGAADVELRFDRLLPALAEYGVGLRFYAEYAGRQWRPFDDGFVRDDGTPHALYTSTELTWGRWGAGLETKRYHQFNLKVNDPPSLVPEFGHHLLNRGTHVLDAHDERGWQLNIHGALPGGWTTRLVNAQAVNRRQIGDAFSGAERYDLYFVEVQSPATDEWRVDVWGSAGQDESVGIESTRLGGLRLEHDLAGGWSVAAETEFLQEKKRVFDEERRSDNVVAILTGSLAGRGSLGLVAEFSNDLEEKDLPVTPGIEDEPRAWFGATLNVQLTDSHDVTVFGGKRRGGTACTSGTCYEVPDFSGLEIRVGSRF